MEAKDLQFNTSEKCFDFFFPNILRFGFLTDPIPKSLGIVGCLLRRSGSEMRLYLSCADGATVLLMSAKIEWSGIIITARGIKPKSGDGVGINQKKCKRQYILRKKMWSPQYNLCDTITKQSAGSIHFSKGADHRREGHRETTLIISHPKSKINTTPPPRQRPLPTTATTTGTYEVENDRSLLPNLSPSAGFGNRASVLKSRKNTVVNNGLEIGSQVDRIWLFTKAKAGPNVFNLDMAWPLSPVQAFAFGIAALRI